MKTWFGIIVLAYKTNPLRILLVENTQTGNITPISGAVENDETQIEAAIREVKEEVGWIVSSKLLHETSLNHIFIYGINKAERAGDKGVNKVFLFNADKLPEPQKTNDIRSFKWLPLKEAASSISFPDLQEIIKEASKLLSKDR